MTAPARGAGFKPTAGVAVMVGSSTFRGSEPLLLNPLAVRSLRLANATRFGFAVCVFVIAPSRMLAWHETGHKIVAAIAYNELDPRDRASVDSILKQHTNYRAWRGDFEAARTTLSEGQFVFMQASVWPDKIRDNNRPETHPEWHYIDYPLRPPEFPDLPAAHPKADVVSAIDGAVEALQNERTGKRNKAECLSWLIHLVGDIHQPLHCSSLFGGPFRGKEGDRGGNSFWIRMREDSARPIKLHTLWDGLPGTGKDPDRLAKKAEELVGAHPRGDFPSHTFGTAPVEWSKESRRLSLEKAYQPLPSLDGTQAHPVVVPPGYFTNSKALAEERVTLAGYRLADQIHAQLAAR